MAENLLINPGFEDEFTERQGAGELKVPKRWNPFWSTGDPPHEHSQGPCCRPEYKPALRSLDPRRVVEGEKAACWFAFSKVMDAGIYQRVPVEKGKTYEFSVSVQTWCSNSDDPSKADGEMYVALGIDPYGRTDAFELGVVWTYWHRVSNEHEMYVSLAVVAQADHITVFIRGWNKWRLRHGDLYADDAALCEVEGPSPTPEPEPGEIDYERIRGVVREELDKTRLGQ